MNKGIFLRGMVSFWFIFRDTQINSTPLTIKQPEYGTQEMNTSSTTPSKLGVSNVLTQNFVRRCHRKAACSQSLERSQCSFNPVDAVCVDSWHLKISDPFFFVGIFWGHFCHAIVAFGNTWNRRFRAATGGTGFRLPCPWIVVLEMPLPQGHITWCKLSGTPTTSTSTTRDAEFSGKSHFKSDGITIWL